VTSGGGVVGYRTDAADPRRPSALAVAEEHARLRGVDLRAPGRRPERAPRRLARVRLALPRLERGLPRQRPAGPPARPGASEQAPAADRGGDGVAGDGFDARGPPGRRGALDGGG